MQRACNNIIEKCAKGLKAQRHSRARGHPWKFKIVAWRAHDKRAYIFGAVLEVSKLALSARRMSLIHISLPLPFTCSVSGKTCHKQFCFKCRLKTDSSCIIQITSKAGRGPCGWLAHRHAQKPLFCRFTLFFLHVLIIKASIHTSFC